MATFRNAGISGDFVHESLSDPQAEIRLVQIDLSGDKDSEIHCTISAHSIKDAPPYVAISYTWGDIGKDQRRIWVNGERINVGHNSWLALWQARLHHTQQPLRIWIDVLSIDQANDAEKSIQVGLMGCIYAFAESVLASVGEHEDDSEHLIEQVYAHSEYIEERRSLTARQEDPPSGPIEQYPCCVSQRRLGNLAYLCVFCEDSPWFCFDCASDHQQPRKFPNESSHICHGFDTFGDKCDNCGRPLPFRWYESRVPIKKLCRTCEVLYRSRAGAKCTWILTDVWGAVDKPPSRKFFRQRSTCFTFMRLLELSDESLQRVAKALSAFSFRSYFTRLWVSASITSLQFIISS
jgi:hypothetical protein